ncbi:MAG: hypothetical protein AB1411_16770 [Nitrospirota bacterium]
MNPERPRPEALVLEALSQSESLTIEQLADTLTELSWSEIFLAIDSLSRRGDIILRRHGFSYELSPVRPDSRYAELHASPVSGRK